MPASSARFRGWISLRGYRESSGGGKMPLWLLGTLGKGSVEMANPTAGGEGLRMKLCLIDCLGVKAAPHRRP